MFSNSSKVSQIRHISEICFCHVSDDGMILFVDVIVVLVVPFLLCAEFPSVFLSHYLVRVDFEILLFQRFDPLCETQ